MKYLLTILATLGFVLHTMAQSMKLENENSTMVIQGTSSLHDWESDVNNISLEANFEGDKIAGIKFKAIVQSIKSGKSAMDGNTYKALKEDKYPEIRFASDQLSIQEDKLVGTGRLTIAGNSQDIPINLIIKQNPAMIITGSVKIKMTDYDITPPTAVFGTIKTGDEITIRFNFTLINS